MVVNLRYKRFNPHNFKYIIEKNNKSNKLNKKLEGVSVITVTNNGLFIDNIFKNFNRQIYKNKELIIVLNKNSLNIEEYKAKAKKYKNIKVYKKDENYSLGHCLNFAVGVSKYEIVAKFDNDDYYGPQYLSSSMEVFKKTGADIVGKSSHLVYFQQSKILAIRDPNRENKYVGFVNGSTLMFKKNVIKRVPFANISIGEDTQFCRNCVKKGIRIYSSDMYHHVYIRRKSRSSHTWKVSDRFLLGMFCKPIMHTKDYISYANKTKKLPI